MDLNQLSVSGVLVSVGFCLDRIGFYPVQEQEEEREDTPAVHYGCVYICIH